ncbi:glycosyltransferase involved in cell wall biosynthesis [Epilithonimonas hungarica]|uniref:glycosyltransferase family 2 protein n=1 Tax=Epilithonimonas hungarica TaxID=454006 RepID=UPI002789FE91|nr:glycosyltransferase family 2 protein [Epilithonimonas hungarica]MDP9956830.1 glycosyltransferase involved in cell wall biosynthesis [Epilithonimonas hungarica]
MLVSIIIPCHNCSLTINRAVNSVFSQTHKDWELILVNNNSSDDTWQKLIEIKEQNQDKAITVLDEKKKGAPAARNKGLYQAQGEWIQFLDADDELLNNKIEVQIHGVINHCVDFIYSPFFKVKDIENVFEKKYRKINSNLWEGLILSELGITSANLFKKKALILVKGWDEDLSSSQEYDLMFRILLNGGIAKKSDEALTLIHYEFNSIANTSEKAKVLRRLFNFADLRYRIIEYLQSEKNKSKYQSAYETIISKEFVRNFRTDPLMVFIKFNKIKKLSFNTVVRTNWIFLKLKIRLIFNILPE